MLALVIIIKSTKVQTLGAVALHATTDCTDDASIVGLGPLNWAIRGSDVLHSDDKLNVIMILL